MENSQMSALEQLEQCKVFIADLVTKYNQLVEQAEAEHKEFDYCKQFIVEQNNNIQEYEEYIHQLQSQKVTIEYQMKQMQIVIDEQQKAMTDEQIAQLTSLITRQDDENDQLQDQIKQLNEKVAKLQSQLKAKIFNSPSISRVPMTKLDASVLQSSILRTECSPTLQSIILDSQQICTNLLSSTSEEQKQFMQQIQQKAEKFQNILTENEQLRSELEQLKQCVVPQIGCDRPSTHDFSGVIIAIQQFNCDSQDNILAIFDRCTNLSTKIDQIAKVTSQLDYELNIKKAQSQSLQVSSLRSGVNNILQGSELFGSLGESYLFGSQKQTSKQLEIYCRATVNGVETLTNFVIDSLSTQQENTNKVSTQIQFLNNKTKEFQQKVAIINQKSSVLQKKSKFIEFDQFTGVTDLCDEELIKQMFAKYDKSLILGLLKFSHALIDTQIETKKLLQEQNLVKEQKLQIQQQFQTIVQLKQQHAQFDEQIQALTTQTKQQQVQQVFCSRNQIPTSNILLQSLLAPLQQFAAFMSQNNELFERAIYKVRDKVRAHSFVSGSRQLAQNSRNFSEFAQIQTLQDFADKVKIQQVFKGYDIQFVSGIAKFADVISFQKSEIAALEQKLSTFNVAFSRFVGNLSLSRTLTNDTSNVNLRNLEILDLETLFQRIAQQFKVMETDHLQQTQSANLNSELQKTKNEVIGQLQEELNHFNEKLSESEAQNELLRQQLEKQVVINHQLMQKLKSVNEHYKILKHENLQIKYQSQRGGMQETQATLDQSRQQARRLESLYQDLKSEYGRCQFQLEQSQLLTDQLQLDNAVMIQTFDNQAKQIQQKEDELKSLKLKLLDFQQTSAYSSKNYFAFQELSPNQMFGSLQLTSANRIPISGYHTNFSANPNLNNGNKVECENLKLIIEKQKDHIFDLEERIAEVGL